jgi:hypothetical protein
MLTLPEPVTLANALGRPAWAWAAGWLGIGHLLPLAHQDFVYAQDEVDYRRSEIAERHGSGCIA